MQIELTKQSSNELQVKESWSKPELVILAIKEATLGTHSLNGADASFSS